MMKFKRRRSRTPSKYVFYALHLYFSGLSLRKASECLLPFIKRNHVSIWNWIQRHKPIEIWKKRKKVSEFIVDETLIQVGNQSIWLWIAIEPVEKIILDIRISLERSMLIAERFLQNLIKKYGKHQVSTDGGTWYPQACKFLKLNHHIHSYYEKSIIERTIQYIKDRTECFDDYFPCPQKVNCNLEHIHMVALSLVPQSETDCSITSNCMDSMVSFYHSFDNFFAVWTSCFVLIV